MRDTGTTASGNNRSAPPIGFIFLLLLLYGLLAVGTIHFSMEVTVGVFVAFVVYLLTFMDIRVGLVLMLVAIGISPEMEFSGISMRIEDFIIPAVTVAWITRMIDRREALEPSPLKMPILLLLFAMAVSSLNGTALGYVPGKTAFFHYFKYVQFMLIYVLALNNIRTLREIYTFVTALVAVSAIVGLYGIWQYFNRGEYYSMYRITGPYGETASVLGGYLTFHIVMAIGLFIHAGSVRVRVFLGILIVVLLFPFLYTLSRSAYVALLGGLVLLGVVKRRKLLVGIFVILVLFPIIFPVEVVQRVSSILDVFYRKPPSSWSARVDAWKYYSQFIIQAPLIGHGAGVVPLGFVDNEYIKQLLEGGIAGLLLFLWFLFRVIRTCLAMVDRLEDRVLKGFVTGYLGGLFSLMIQGVAITNFTTIRTMEPFFFATGIVTVIAIHYARLAKEPGEAEDVVPERIPAPPGRPGRRAPALPQRRPFRTVT
ncbi:MAG: O-antigen ligase family protein [Planctomycetota bacterium]